MYSLCLVQDVPQTRHGQWFICDIPCLHTLLLQHAAGLCILQSLMTVTASLACIGMHSWEHKEKMQHSGCRGGRGPFIQ